MTEVSIEDMENHEIADYLLESGRYDDIVSIVSEQDTDYTKYFLKDPYGIDIREEDSFPTLDLQLKPLDCLLPWATPMLQQRI